MKASQSNAGDDYASFSHGYEGLQREQGLVMDDKDFWRSEKVAFLALSSLKGVSYWTLRKIAESDSSFKDAFINFEKFKSAPVEKEEQKSLNGDSSLSQEQAWQTGLKLARYLAGCRTQLYFSGEPEFPAKLKNIQDAPRWIFVQGDLQNLSKPAISIVGTRKPNDDGLFITKYSIACLAKLGCITVSGLALGIDQLTHSESIRYGIPTVAVLGTGILNDYPRGSEELRSEILEKGGTIISEYLPAQSYSAENFVRRNRLQAALGDVLIPAQWDIKSGTAHTVKFAANSGKLIINLHLPFTRERRPEIFFSISEYGAISFEIPTKTEEFIRILKARALGIIDTTEPDISENPEANQFSNNKIPPEFELTSPDESPTDQPDQLSLI